MNEQEAWEEFEAAERILDELEEMKARLPGEILQKRMNIRWGYEVLGPDHDVDELYDELDWLYDDLDHVNRLLPAAEEVVKEKWRQLQEFEENWEEMMEWWYTEAGWH